MFKVWISLLVLVFGNTPVLAASSEVWDNAIACYNSEDYACAFKSSVELYREEKIVVGRSTYTTDSMTFLQMAFVDAAARGNTEEKMEMIRFFIREVSHTQNRLPFVFGFALLVAADICRKIDDGKCVANFERHYCSIYEEIPKPYWRKLDNTNRLSENGQQYFDSLMSQEPKCGGA
jgi:hypothetical protein